MVNIKKDAKHNIAVLSATTMVQVQSTKYKKKCFKFVFCILSISAFLVGVQKQSTKLEFLLTLSRSIVPCGEQNKK